MSRMSLQCQCGNGLSNWIHLSETVRQVVPTSSRIESLYISIVFSTPCSFRSHHSPLAEARNSHVLKWCAWKDANKTGHRLFWGWTQPMFHLNHSPILCAHYILCQGQGSKPFRSNPSWFFRCVDTRHWAQNPAGRHLMPRHDSNFAGREHEANPPLRDTRWHEGPCSCFARPATVHSTHLQIPAAKHGMCKAPALPCCSKQYPQWRPGAVDGRTCVLPC